MSSPGYPGALPVQAVVERLAMAGNTRLHQFWADDLSLLDPTLLDPSRIHGPRQITDLYLLALAMKNERRRATLSGCRTVRCRIFIG
jgi:hypothetical protein